MLSTKIIRQHLAYDLETGWLTWKIPGKRRNAKRAGSLNKSNGYRQITVNGIAYKEHVLIWQLVTGKRPTNPIDHKNHVKDDNRWNNLREVTYVQNSQNRAGPNKSNASRYLGVSKYGDRFRAMINAKGKCYHLGIFATAEEANKAYLSAKAKYHKDEADVQRTVGTVQAAALR